MFNLAVPVSRCSPVMPKAEKILKRKAEGGEKPPVHLLPPGARSWQRSSTLTVSVFAIQWCKPAVSSNETPFAFHMVKQHMLAVPCHPFKDYIHGKLSPEKSNANTVIKKTPRFSLGRVVSFYTLFLWAHHCGKNTVSGCIPEYTSIQVLKQLQTPLEKAAALPCSSKWWYPHIGKNEKRFFPGNSQVERFHPFPSFQNIFPRFLAVLRRAPLG